MSTDTLPAAVRALFAEDDRVVTVRHYESGFLPRAYKWPVLGRYTDYKRDGSTTTGEYDRKRPNGKGPAYVGYSAKGGVLAKAT